MSVSLEKSFFFSGSQDRNLYGFLHGVDTDQKTIGLIYCHPFAEEKNMSHSVLVKSARMFAKEGFPVLRFDLSGCGDSEGNLNCVSIADWQEDLEAAVQVFTRETGVLNYMIWGLRLGAGLALLHVEKDEKVSGLILWQPVFDFSLHLKQFLRRMISSEIVKTKKSTEPVSVSEVKLLQDEEVTVIGYPITKNFYNSCKVIGSCPSLVKPTIPTFLLSVSLSEVAATAFGRYSAKLNEYGTPVTMQHIKAEPFWDHYWQWELDEAAAVTLSWLKQLEEGGG